MLYYHPTTISVLLVALLALTKRYDRPFRAIAVMIPLLIAYILYSLEGSHSYTIFNIQLKATFEANTILIAYAFTAIIFTANLYSLGNHKKNEIILGCLYGAFSYMALFASDMISLIIALELMMIFSTCIIFIGGRNHSVKSSKRYFMTHLISGNMIIIGICYLITKTNSTEIINLTTLITDQEYSNFILIIMLVGLIINIASFPFSGWMVNYYPEASPSGFLYLITFTTKVSVIVLLKFFAGCEILKYLGILIIISASIRAVLEKNLFSLLCLLSIMQIGFITVIISAAEIYPEDDSNNWMIHAASSYLFLHILYKGLLSLVVAAISDHGKIEDCSHLKRIKNPTIIFALTIGIAAIINIPLSSSFIIKTYASHFFINNLIYFMIIFLSMMTIIALPLYRYIKPHETLAIHLNITTKISIYCASIITLITTFGANYIPYISQIPSFNETELFSADSMKQLTIITIAVIVALFLKRSRIHSKALNIVEILGDILIFIYHHLDSKNKHDNHEHDNEHDNEHENKNEEKEPLLSEHTTKQFISRLNILHNQQTAIFIVLTIFIILLVSFITRI